jgi:DNA (cytosine-5)-methyltransferase 1
MMNELALFAGAGGGILAGKELGWRTICGVERDAYAAGVLAQRQNDGSLSPFPIWSDVTTFDGTRWRGRVDVVSGGFPCQDVCAGGRGEGIEGERSGLWVQMARIILEVRPRYVFVENSPMLTSRGLGRVLGDMAKMGFNAEWGVLGAEAVGANHTRDRIWIVAYSNGYGSQTEHKPCINRKKTVQGLRRHIASSARFPCRSEFIRKPHGMAFYVDRVKAIGNGQVPLCAAEAFRQLMNRIERYS